MWRKCGGIVSTGFGTTRAGSTKNRARATVQSTRKCRPNNGHPEELPFEEHQLTEAQLSMIWHPESAGRAHIVGMIDRFIGKLVSRSRLAGDGEITFETMGDVARSWKERR